MMVLNDKCKECKHICYVKNFQQNFKNWTSGNNNIDEFIRDIQLSAHKDVREALEWIPNNKFNNVKCITKNRYIANWIDGNIINWDNSIQDWKREGQNMIVELEVLNNPKNITLEFIDKVRYIPYNYLNFVTFNVLLTYYKCRIK
jgi:hypothetical protein